MLFAALKDKKKPSGRYEGKYAFQAIAIELYKQPKQTKKRTPKIINNLFIYYLFIYLLIICLKYYKNIYLLFICFLYCAKEGQVVENIEGDVATLNIVTATLKWKRRRE